MVAISLRPPTFRSNWWPLCALAEQITLPSGARVHDRAIQLDAAHAVLQGWPLPVMTLRRRVDGVIPLDRRSLELASALLDHRDPERCAVWMSQDDHEVRLVLGAVDGALPLAAILDPVERWTSTNALANAGHRGRANRLEYTARTWFDYELTVREVLDMPDIEEIEAWLDR